MKKLIALTLVVLCCGMFSLGCAKTEAPKPAAEPTPAADAPAADADKPAEDAAQ